jgi:RNA polymerase sigma-70 factor (ECF subfamily)
LNIITERILLSRIKNKDRKAAVMLIDKHYKLVYYFLFKLCKQHEIAQDLTQETFIKVWDKIDSFNGSSRFSTWLYRVSYNVFVDYKRLKKLEMVTIEDSELEFIPERFDATDNISSRLQYESIRKNVEKLSEKNKEVILLHYEEDLSYNEISEIINIPIGTVKSRINSALSELRSKMKL